MAHPRLVQTFAVEVTHVTIARVKTVDYIYVIHRFEVYEGAQ